MPDAGEVRDGLVWTGTEWVPLKPPTSNELPDEHKPEKPSNDIPKKIVCPNCHESNQLVKVSGLLDKSKTSQTSYTFGTAVGVGTGGIGVGMGDAVTDTQGTNALAQHNHRVAILLLTVWPSPLNSSRSQFAAERIQVLAIGAHTAVQIAGE